LLSARLGEQDVLHGAEREQTNHDQPENKDSGNQEIQEIKEESHVLLLREFLWADGVA
jgi:hypothetical protein